MKKTIVLVSALVCFSFLYSKAQILTPVHWSYGAKKISATEVMVFLKATIDDGWHVYSQKVKDGGPIKTSFAFTASKDYKTVGPTIEPTPILRMEKVFNMEVGYFEKSVIFQQKIKVKSSEVMVKGTLEYMTCNDHQCLPPEDIDFNIPVK